MFMNTSGVHLVDKKPLVADRCINAVPRRSPDAVWDLTAEYIATILQARGFPRSAESRKALEALRPVVRYLLTMHSLEMGRLELDTQDLQVTVSFRYGMTDVVEDLSLPPFDILGPIPDKAQILLKLFVDRQLDPVLSGVVMEVNASSPLVIQVIHSGDMADTGDKPSKEEKTNGSNH